MTPALQIDRLDAAGLARHRPALVALLLDSVGHGASVGFLADLDADAAGAYFDQVQQALAEGAQWLWIAQRQGQVLGSVQLGLCQKPNGLNRAEVQKLLVLSTARRQGIVVLQRTRTTRSNTLMSYIQLEDDTGAMELIAFQNALDRGGEFVSENAPLFVDGRISVRDEKEPQLMVDTIRPLTEEALQQLQISNGPAPKPPAPEEREAQRIWVRLPSKDDKRVQRIGLILQMFPGTRQQLVLYFEDTKKRAAAPCLIHEALIDELRELAGEENVVVK